MGIEKFGKISFTTDTKAIEFFANLEQGKVTASRCRKCGTSYFPPRMDCANCLQSDMEWVEIKGSGKLVTYTRVGFSPAGFEDDTQYILAIVDFGWIKVFGRLKKDTKDEDIKVGMELALTPVILPGNRFSYEFQAV